MTAQRPPARITVVTCSYNQGRFLEDTVLSVVNQGYPNLEYMIFDGGSKDNSVEIIKKYEQYLAHWVSEPDEGQSDALSKGFDRATGDILCWLCSDDLLEPGTLHEVGRFFAEHPEVDVVFGDARFIDEAGVVTRQFKTFPFSSWLLLNTANYIPQPSTFWRRRIYDRVGGLDKSLHLSMDLDLWLRFGSVSLPRHIPRYWSRMRYYPQNKSMSLKHVAQVEAERLQLRYLGKRSAPLRATSIALARLTRISRKIVAGCYWG
jgi:glycosyltransferase involved in cell wall biosynthesis